MNDATDIILAALLQAGADGDGGAVAELTAMLDKPDEAAELLRSIAADATMTA